MQHSRGSLPDVDVSVSAYRNGSTVVVIACSTILMALTQLIQTFYFWISHLQDAETIVRLTPPLGLALQSVTPVALLGLSFASTGLLRGKPWGRPLFTWAAVIWLLATALLSFWIATIVNLPVYLLAIWLLNKRRHTSVLSPPVSSSRLSLRSSIPVLLLALSSTLHLWAWLAAISPASWVWALIPDGHPWHLLLPSAMLFIAGVWLSSKASKLRNAGVSLMVFCVAMGAMLVASTVTSTELRRFMPDPKPYGELPYGPMLMYIAFVASIALSLLRYSSPKPPDEPQGSVERRDGDKPPTEKWGLPH